MNGLIKKIGVAGLVGAAGVLITMMELHDRKVTNVVETAGQIKSTVEKIDNEIVARKAFQDEIGRNILEWRQDQVAFRMRLSQLESDRDLAKRERANIYRWMERVSVALHVAPPDVAYRGQPRSTPDAAQR